MKILHFYRTYFPDTQGGLEEVIRQICLTTKPLGVENRILTISDRPSPEPIFREEGTVYQVKKNLEIASCTIGFDAIKKYRELAEWADVVHLHYPWPFSDVVSLMSGARRPTVLTYHSDIVRQNILKWVYAPLKTRYLESVDTIVTTSPNYAESSSALSRYKSKLEVIPIGIDRASYPNVSEDNLSAASARYGTDFFLFVGVLRYYKGLHVLLKAMKNADYTLLIAGAGPMEAKLKKQAQALGLNNVEFLGYIPDEEKVALYHLCRAVILPSHLRSEAFGVSLLEAAMYGKPLICAEIETGTTYINVHEKTGIVVKPDDSNALRCAMDKLNGDDNLSRTLGEAALSRYDELFTGKAMGERYYQLYRRLAVKIIDRE
ncbi:MAG: glycosyltransferase involved in cell wall biosynthesis [Oceanicoccus sp.]|jgi:glycosyltransferase involved in cell wall biosynthesis